MGMGHVLAEASAGGTERALLGGGVLAGVQVRSCRLAIDLSGAADTTGRRGQLRRRKEVGARVVPEVCFKRAARGLNRPFQNSRLRHASAAAVEVGGRHGRAGSC